MDIGAVLQAQVFQERTLP